jgi:hypothetical protein
MQTPYRIVKRTDPLRDGSIFGRKATVSNASPAAAETEPPKTNKGQGCERLGNENALHYITTQSVAHLSAFSHRQSCAACPCTRAFGQSVLQTALLQVTAADRPACVSQHAGSSPAAPHAEDGAASTHAGAAPN